jgi:hypothetical protein
VAADHIIQPVGPRFGHSCFTVYSGGARFEFCPGHRLYRLKFFLGFPPSLQALA